MSKAPSVWAAGIAAVQDEAAGVLEIVVIRPPDLPELLIDASLGSIKAGELSRLAFETLLTVHKAPRRKPILCLSCQQPVRAADAFAVVLVVPRRPDPARCLSSVMCASCGVETAKIEAKTIVAMRDLWPDARAVGIIHPEGHA